MVTSAWPVFPATPSWEHIPNTVNRGQGGLETRDRISRALGATSSKTSRAQTRPGEWPRPQRLARPPFPGWPSFSGLASEGC